MRVIENIEAFWSRLAPRERRLFLMLVGLVVVIVAGGAWFGAYAYLSSLESEIREMREAVAEIKRLAPKYVEWTSVKAETERLVRENKVTSIRVAANEILKRLELKGEIQGASGSQMSDIVSFEGKVTETPVGLAKKKGKGKTVFSGLVQVDQKLEFREVPWENLFEFLDEVSKSQELLFVTKLEVARKFNNMANVRAELSISTFQFQEKASEEGVSKGEQKGGPK